MKAPKQKYVRVPYEEFREITSKLKRIEESITGGVASKMQELLTVRDVCDILKISRATFDTYKNQQLFPCYNLKGRIYVKMSELEDAINNSKVGPSKTH